MEEEGSVSMKIKWRIKDKNQYVFTGLIFLAFLILIVVRLYRFGDIPGGVNRDEAFQLLYIFYAV